MKNILCFAILWLLTNNSTSATIRRVGYWGSAVANVDYATPDAAVTAASVGDTIQLYPNTTIWNFSNINKRLVIIGVGYYHYPGANGFANYNANLQIAQPWSYCTLVFFPGSDGTIITGCDIGNCIANGTAGISNIKITNCRLIIVNFSQANTYDNWEISKCDFYGAGISSGNTGSKITNLKVFNCIFEFSNLNNISPVSGQAGIFENCIFLGSVNFYNQSFLVQNSIFFSSALPLNFSNCIFNNNIFTGAPAVAGTGNVTGVNGNNLFLGYPTQGAFSNDERLKSKVGSPAFAAGINGVDCGVFGGVNPYKLSGIPAIPAFYKITAPSSATSGNPYTITFSVRANN